MKVRVRLGAGLVALVLASCGGGGGSGGGSSGLRVNPGSVALTRIDGDSGTQAVQVQISWSSGAVAQLVVGVPAGQTKPAWLDATLTGTASPLTLELRVPSGIIVAAGQYAQTIRVVTGDASGNLIDYLDFQVTLEVIARPTLSPGSVPLAWVESELPPPVQLTGTHGPAVHVTGVTTSVPWLTATVTEAVVATPESGETVSITPTAAAAALAPGAHPAVITVTYAAGASTTTRTVAVAATVASALSAAPLAFDVDGATTDGALSAALRGTVASATHAALTLDPEIAVTWLTAAGPVVTGTANNLALAVPKARLAELPNGTYRGTVKLTARGASVVPLSVPVTLTVRLPEVTGVMPVAFTDTADDDYVVVRGAGLSKAGPSLLVDAEPPSSVTVTSDTEARVVPGARAAGAYPVTVANALGLTRGAGVLHVIPPPSYATTTLATTAGAPSKMVASPVHHAVFGATCWFCSNAPSATTASTVQRYAYDVAAGTWSSTARSYPNLYDVALSPDESALIVLTATQLLLVNPDTMETTRTVPLPSQVSGVADQLAVMNDGTVLIQALSRAYSLRDGTFKVIPGLNLDTGLVGSRDGSRAFMGSANYYQTTPYQVYDAAAAQVLRSETYLHYAWGLASRHADRWYTNTYLLGRDLVLLTMLPSSAHSSAATLSPDGRRLYAYSTASGTGSFLRRYDLTDPNAVVELAPIAVPPGAAGRFAMDPRGQYVYAAGATQFVVIDVR